MGTNLDTSEAFCDVEIDDSEAQIHPAIRFAIRDMELEDPDIRIHPVIENAEHIPEDDAPGVDAGPCDAK
jgi:hypothetical protein